MIVDRFGDKALDVLEMQPDKLAEIKGISATKAKDISAGFKKQAGVRRLTEFLFPRYPADIRPAHVQILR